MNLEVLDEIDMNELAQYQRDEFKNKGGFEPVSKPLLSASLNLISVAGGTMLELCLLL